MTSDLLLIPMVTVCLVEDHPQLRGQLCELLADAGMDVLAAVGTVHDGEDAVISRLPDVAVIDNRLPDGFGVDLIRILSRRAPQVALLLHSAVVTAGVRRDALQAGAAAAIAKTMRGDGLIDAIRTAAAAPSSGRPPSYRRLIRPR